MNRRLRFSAIRDRLLLELDLLVWRFRTAPLRRRRDFPPPEKRILLCNVLATIAGMKAEALFAAALRGRGYTPVVLLSGRYSLVERYFRAAGPVEFVYLDTLADDDIRRTAYAEADARMRADPELSTLFDWSPDGYRIGRNVLSTVVRRFRVGRIDPDNPEHRSAVSEVLVQSLVTKAACEAMLDQVRPASALFNERGYTPAAEIFDGCLLRNVDCIQWFGAPQSDCLAYKRYRAETRDQHPLSLADDTWAMLLRRPWAPADDKRVLGFLQANYETEAWFNRQKLQEGKKILSPDSVRERLKLDPSKKTAVIFSHILYDATFFYGESLFPDYETWLVETVRCAVANAHLNWVIKVHPVNVWRSRMDGAAIEQLEVRAIERAIGPLPDHIKILPADTDINTYSLFSVADYGLTVRGTIGLELPCFGVPVVTAGSGRYSGRGFTIDPETPEAFRQMLAHLHQVPPLDADKARLARRYAYGSFFLRPLRMEGFILDFKANTFGSSALSNNTRPNPAYARRLETAGDLDRFCQWHADGMIDDLVAADIFIDAHTEMNERERETNLV